MRGVAPLSYVCVTPHPLTLAFFFFNDTATTEIYTLSLHDALPISDRSSTPRKVTPFSVPVELNTSPPPVSCTVPISEEHTAELQSRQYLVCRLLLATEIFSVPVRFSVLAVRLIVSIAAVVKVSSPL